MNKRSKFRYSPEERALKQSHRTINPIAPSPWTKGHIDDIGSVHLVPPDTLVDFFNRCIQTLQDLKGEDIGDYLEFGVFNGSSIGSMYLAKQKQQANTMRLFGFDAFQGLPAEAEHDDDGVWEEGFYACSFEDMKQCLIKRGINPDNMEWVKGWYKDTLSPGLSQKFNLSNLGIVFIDCDTYSSSKTVLDFIAPLIQSPVIICLDDWKLNNLDIKGLGEYKAFNKFLEANDHLEAEEIVSYNRKSKSFLVRTASQSPLQR